MPQPTAADQAEFEPVPVQQTGDEAAPRRRRIGELLVDRGRLDPKQLARALRLQQDSGERLGELLVKLNMIAERDLAEALGEQLDLPVVAADDYPQGLVTDVPLTPEFLRQSMVVPVADEDGHVVVAMADPTNEFAVDALRLALGRPISIQIGVLSDIESAIQRQFGESDSSMAHIIDGIDADSDQDVDDVQYLKDLASEAPIIRLVNVIMARALEARASDIHVEPFETRLKVRYRIDGVLHDVEAPPMRSTAAVISRIKVMANLNIAERRLPQDGRIKLRIEGREVDLRISTVPTMHGESVVLRILDKSSVPLEFQSLGFEGETLAGLEAIITRPHGIVLVTGPTGSGKTTTLYTALENLNTADRKILTVEDPVEYQLEGVNQIQIRPQIGLSFAGALRSILRQDPDVIMVGEMRDLETARIAVQAALTGHLVFSTLHTNDAASSVTRLLEMGVEDYLVTSTVNGVVAQRLVRTLCTRCREPYRALPQVVDEVGLAPLIESGRHLSNSDPIRPELNSTGAQPDEVILYRAVGCPECGGSGYLGRTCILELLVISDRLRAAVLDGGDAMALRAAASAEGATTMYEDGLRKSLAGITTVEEVKRVTSDA